MKLNNIFSTILVFGLLSCIHLSCKKLVEVKSPVTSLNSTNVYTSDETATSVLTGIYTQLTGSGSFISRGFTTISIFGGLSADELTLFPGTSDIASNAYYTNKLTSLNIGGTDFWSKTYPYIYAVNSAIEGLTASTTLTPAVRQQLLGESRFLRAFFYFYLVNLYGEVVIVEGTDFTTNSSLQKSPVSDVYDFIISDLKEAQLLLTDNYVDGSVVQLTDQRVRPNKWAATALLARAYLYKNDFMNAEAESTKVIQETTLYNLSATLNEVFLSNNIEAIWQLQPVGAITTNTSDAKNFILPKSGPNTFGFPFYLSDNLLYNFENGDQRRVNWVDSVIVSSNTYYYPFKYKVNAAFAPVTEYLTILRLAEQYLIRAEARASQENYFGAQDDLNMIRNRAGLSNTTALNKEELLTAILHERQIEFFTEWGHRWLDLKRTQTIDSVMTQVSTSKQSTWESYQQVYPIPSTDIQSNPKLTQNNGY